MNVNNKIGVKARNHIRSKQVLFKMTPCCLAISAIFAQQAYAETVTQTAEVSENATQKPVTQLQKKDCSNCDSYTKKYCRDCRYSSIY